MSVCLSVCIDLILLTAGPIWFAFTVNLLIGPDKVYNYLGVGFLEKIPTLRKKYVKYFFSKLILKRRVDPTPPPLA